MSDVARPEDRKIDALEGLRGIMAWWVVAGHLGHTFGSEAYLLLRNGLAVDVFIVLSGFVIYRLIETKREPYAPYLIRRAARLLPVYLVVLAVSALLLPVFAEAMRGVPFASDRNALRVVQADAAMADLAPHLAAHVVLLQGLIPASVLPHAAYTIVGQAWSISLEWQFYVLAPFVALAVARRWWLPLIAAVAALMLLSTHLSEGFIGSKALLFGIGSGTQLVRRERRYWPFLAACSATYLMTGGNVIQLLIWSAAFGLKAPLSNRAIVYLGSRSYSTYMLHMLPIYLGAWALNGRLAGWEYIAALSAITVAFVLTASELSYRWIERPGMDLGKRLAQRARKPLEA